MQQLLADTTFTSIETGELNAESFGRRHQRPHQVRPFVRIKFFSQRYPSAFPFPVHSCRTQRYSLPVRAGSSHGRTSRVRVSENISCPVCEPAIHRVAVM